MLGGKLSRLTVAGIGAVGFFGGILTEKYYSHRSQRGFAQFEKAENYGGFGRDFGGLIGGILNEKLNNFAQVSAAGSFGTGGGGGMGGGGGAVIPLDGAEPYLSEKTKKPTRTAQIMKFGFPGMDNIRSYNDFVLSYDQRNRVPHWVFEHLTRSHVKHNPEVDRAKCDFHEDSSVHRFFRSTNSDYKSSGYDRGHLAAAGNHRLSQTHVDETFVLSNIAPQVGKGFNRDAWNNLEKYVRGQTKRYENVYVCSGPLYLPRREPDGKYYVKYEVIGQNNVAVPTHFFKVVICEEGATGQLDLESFVMPNKPIDGDIPVTSFRVPLETIERAAGLLFCDRIPRQAFRYINGKRT